jgi:pimeloyl-ACP methyl ester carboxylesterase
MPRLASLVLGAFGLTAGGFALSQVMATRAARAYPPSGLFVPVEGGRLHLHDLGPRRADAPAILLLHGASANSGDMLLALGPTLARSSRVIVVDRPGHGWSDRPGGRADSSPARQAALIRQAIDAIGVERAVVVGHSWSGALATAFALDHPDRTAGLVLLGGATHPWSTGVAWYNTVASDSRLAPLFNRIVAPAAVSVLLDKGAEAVFSPNTMPDDYVRRTGTALLLRPSEFQANAEDLVDLVDFVSAQQARYPLIRVPTTIIHGDADTVVSPEIHSKALARQVAGSRLVMLPDVGHMPHHARRETVAAEIEAVVAQATATRHAAAGR